jgi:hypothetical protein
VIVRGFLRQRFGVLSPIQGTKTGELPTATKEKKKKKEWRLSN